MKSMVDMVQTIALAVNPGSDSLHLALAHMDCSYLAKVIYIMIGGLTKNLSVADNFGKASNGSVRITLHKMFCNLKCDATVHHSLKG